MKSFRMKHDIASELQHKSVLSLSFDLNNFLFGDKMYHDTRIPILCISYQNFMSQKIMVGFGYCLVLPLNFNQLKTRESWFTKLSKCVKVEIISFLRVFRTSYRLSCCRMCQKSIFLYKAITFLSDAKDGLEHV